MTKKAAAKKPNNKGAKKPNNKGMKTGLGKGEGSKATQFKKGQPGGPGRPKGSLNFSTRLQKALDKLAKMEGFPNGEELELDIIQNGIRRARAGDYKFYQDMFDRGYGKPKQAVELDGKMENTTMPLTAEQRKRIAEEELKK
jgi:hypothetical protein